MANPWERDWSNPVTEAGSIPPWDREWGNVAPVKPVSKERSWVQVAGDTGVDLAKGVVGFGESAVGLADLATVNLAGKGLALAGYDPARTKQALGDLYSDPRQQANRNVSEVKGFWNTTEALLQNPSVIAGGVAESAPMMMGSVGVVRALAAKLLAARGLVAGTAEAGAFLRSPAVAAKLTLAGSATEGAITAGSIQEQGRQAERDYTDTAPAALVGGALTAAIGFGTSKIPGFRDAEVGVATAGMGGLQRQSLLAAGKEIAKGTFKEGVLEEMPQSSQEQVFTNLALGKPWAEGVPEAAAQGMVVGAAQSGGMNVYSAGRNAMGAPTATPATPQNPPSDPVIAAQEVSSSVAPAPADPIATTVETALLTPVALTALDRVNELDTELAPVRQRLAELTLDASGDPAFDQERLDLTAQAVALEQERISLSKDWPKSVSGVAASFTTEAGARVEAQYALMDAADLITSHDEGLRKNPLYPPELQPRERDRAASEVQVSGINQKLDPARLGWSADAATGAPIVGADGLVESGNARTIALKRVYQQNGQHLAEYKQFLRDNAAQFGLTPESIDGMDKPVLVRVRSTPVNRAEFARQANASTVAVMAPSEQAKSDANRIDSMEDLVPDDSGDFSNAASRSFISRFMARLPTTEQAGMNDANGNLSTSGYARVRNAVLAKAYGDSPVLTRMTESMDDNLRNVSRAFMLAAPKVAAMRSAIKAGNRFDADITPDLMSASEELARIKTDGGSVADALAQTDIMGDQRSPETSQLLQFLSDNMRRPRRMADFIGAYMDALDAAGDPNQGSLLGDIQAPTKQDLLKAAERATTNETTNNGTTTQGVTQQAGGQTEQKPGDAAGGGGSTQSSGVDADTTTQGGEGQAPVVISDDADQAQDLKVLPVGAAVSWQVKGKRVNGEVVRAPDAKGSVTVRATGVEAGAGVKMGGVFNVPLAKLEVFKKSVATSEAAPEVGLAFEKKAVGGNTRTDTIGNGVEGDTAHLKPDASNLPKVAEIIKPEVGAKNEAIHINTVAGLTKALAAMARGTQMSTPKSVSGQGYGVHLDPKGANTLVMTLPTRATSAEAVIATLGKALRQKMIDEGTTMPSDPARMTKDQFAIAYEFGNIIPEFSGAVADLGTQSGPVVTKPDGTFGVNTDALHDQILAQAKAADAVQAIAAPAKEEASPIPAVAGNAAMFSRAQSDLKFVPGATPVESGVLASVINRVTAKWKGNGQASVVVVATFDMLPAPILQAAKDQGYNNASTDERIPGVTWQGKVYLVQENITSEAMAEQTLLHERVHQVLRGNAGDVGSVNLRRTLAKLFHGMGEGPGMVAIASQAGIKMDGIAKQAANLPAAARGLLATEELLADIEGSRAFEKLLAKALRLLREFHGQLRAWMRDNGFSKMASALGEDLNAVTLPDLNFILKGLRQAEAQAGSSAIRFSRVQVKVSAAVVSQTDTPAFKQWREGANLLTSMQSKKHLFVSSDPVVVEAFHGSTHSEITRFATTIAEGAGKTTQTKTATLGAFFTDERLTSDLFSAEGNGGAPTVYKVFVKFKKPLNPETTSASELSELDRAFPGYIDQVHQVNNRKGWLTEAERNIGRVRESQEEKFDGGTSTALKKMNARKSELKSMGFKVEMSHWDRGYDDTQYTLRFYPEKFSGDFDGRDFFDAVQFLASHPDARQRMEHLGYDGIIVQTEMDAPRYKSSNEALQPGLENRYTGRIHQFIVFNPSQIKSAIGNNGDFDGANPDIRMSRGEGGGGMDVVALEKLVSRIQALMPNMPKVNVLASSLDAPPALRGYIEQQGAMHDVEGAMHEGQLYLFASGLPNALRAEHVLVEHEAAHFGLRVILGDSLKGAMQSIYNNNASVRQAATELQRQGKLTNAEATEEVIVDIPSSELVKLKGWRKVVQRVQTWLADHGFEAMAAKLSGWLNGNLNDQERADLLVANLVHAARAYVTGKRGKPVGAADQTTTPAFGTSPDIRLSRLQKAKDKALSLVSPQALDQLMYDYTDKYIDLKRIRDHIKSIGGTISDLNDAYLGEELYHKRLAKRTEDFLTDEVQPLLADLRTRGVGAETFEQFLHARHAPEANKAMAARNPTQAEIDAGKANAKAAAKALEVQLQGAVARGAATVAIEKSLALAKEEGYKWVGAQAFKGTEEERLSLSGMTDAQAQTVMDGLTPAQLTNMKALAARVDAINAKTMDTLAQYGLMDQASLGEWRKAYQFYIPLHRDEAHPDSASHPVGQGFSVKGDAAKRRTGSNAKVTNILGHIAMQREAALTRGEKNTVVKKLYVMAAQNPDPELWSVKGVPTITQVDKKSGFVHTYPDPMYKNKPNVVMVRIAGKDAAIVFNERNPQGVRLAGAMKNIDVGDLGVILTQTARVTRWFSAVNTQYNPVFGLVNFARDIQAAMLNLSTTPLAGQQAKVAKGVPSALRAVYRVERGKAPSSVEGAKWSALWEDLQQVGGTTGYRDMYSDASDRMSVLIKDLQKLDRGQVSRAAHAVVDWLSNYNDAIENGVRLSAYRAALDQGMSRERAASLAKNLTVNFNRKGAKAREIGALYAFFNAAIQGNARMFETLTGPIGKKIMFGGVALGMITSMLGMAVMGGGDGEDDEWENIPEFVKERALVIPLGHEDYMAIPLPLGFHVLPNFGRLMAEWVMGGPDKSLGKQVGKVLSSLVDAYNPVGGGSDIWDVISPTFFDPVLALLRNKDWTGRPIYRDDNNTLDPTPGFTRAKDSASTPGKLFAEAINKISGGNEYRPGYWSPTPDQFDYVIGQVTGGLGRELLKVNQVLTTPFTGDELPAHKVPILGRIYGNTRGAGAQSGVFYENVRTLNEVENEVQGRYKNDDDADGYMAREPLTSLIGEGNSQEKIVSNLRKQRKQEMRDEEPGYKDRVKEINTQIEEEMRVLNRSVLRVKSGVGVE